MEKSLNLLKQALKETNAPIALRRAVIILLADGNPQASILEWINNLYEAETDADCRQCLMDTLAYVRSLEFVLN